MAFYGLNALGTLRNIATTLVSDPNAEIEGLGELPDEQKVKVIDAINGLAATPEAKSNAKKKVFKAGKRGGGLNFTGGSKNMNAKDIFESRMNQLPQAMQRDLMSGKLQLINKVYYSRKFVSSLSNAKMFDTDQLTATGKTNLLNGKMAANKAFACVAIRVTGCTHSETADGDSVLYGCSFGEACNNVLNGEFEFGVGSQNFVEKSPASIFRTTGNSNVPAGLYMLDTPKMVLPQEEVKFELYFAGTAPAKTALSVELIGVETTKS